MTGTVADLADRLHRRVAALDAPRLWAASGAMALTGDADGPPLPSPAPVAALVQAAADVLSEITGSPPLPDPPALLGERAALLGLHRRGQVSCGGGARLLRTADGWVAVALPRPEDRAALPAWLGVPEPGDDPWSVVAAAVAGRETAPLVADARLLEIPCATPGETPPVATPWGLAAARPGERVGDPLVVDLSALWAGPLCGDLLRRSGARVVKVEDPSRPDGSRRGWPAFADLLNGGKQSVAVDLAADAGRRDLARLLAAADVVITSSRPRAFERLGVDVDAVLHHSPTVWVAITGHGWSGPGLDRVGFGDEAAVAGGLAAIGPSDGAPRFLADAVADPLTGVLAAVATAAALAAGGSWLIDAPLARAAAYACGLGPVAAATVPAVPVQTAPVQAAAVQAAPPRARAADDHIRPLGADTVAVMAEVDA